MESFITPAGDPTPNGPALWDEILTHARAAFGHDAVIAGGAVRDYALGFEPEDIDVFVNCTGLELEDFVSELPSCFAVSLLHEATEYHEHPDFMPELSGVLDGWFKNGWRVQFIGRPMPDFSGAALMSRFDVGLSRIWYDGELHMTPEFIRDMEQGTITILRAESAHALQASTERAWTYVRRHPGRFTIVGGHQGHLEDVA